MRFTDPIAFPPKVERAKESWWARPELQTDRAAFDQWAAKEQIRIVGNQRFGGTKKVIDKFPGGNKKHQR